MTTSCPTTLQNPVLPSLPAVILKLIESTDDERKSVKELAELASQDPALSAQILRIANSALVNPGQPVKSLVQASLILGTSTLRHIAITAAVCQTLGRLKIPGRFSINKFWNHSLCCAILCKKLTQFLPVPISEDEAFVAGLLHDIGQLSLVVKRPEDFDKIVQNPRTGQTVLESEVKTWGRDHTEEGFQLLTQWRLPVNICSAARFHHKMPQELVKSTPFLGLIYLGDIAAHFLAKESELSVAELLNQCHIIGIKITKNQLQRLLRETEEGLGATASEFGLEITHKKGLADSSGDDTALTTLRDKTTDLATLVGILESLLLIRSGKELQEKIFAALATLTNLQCGLLFKYANNSLKGVAARGTKDDSIASQIHIIDLNETIWDEAFKRASPVFTGDFFQERPMRLIDQQIKEYLGGDYIALPLAVGLDKVGAMALRASSAQWEGLQESIDFLKLVARQFAHILRGITYRHLWEREHVINKALIRHCPAGIIITDENGHITFVNPSAQELLELNTYILHDNDIINIDDILPLERPADLETLNGPRSIGRKRITTKSGKTKWLEIEITNLPFPRSTSLLFFLKDVTDTVALENERQKRALWLEKELIKRTQELKRAQKKLIQAERLGAASEIARSVVHEVNNPLGIIKNLLKILKIQKETGKIEDKTIDAIGSEIDRVARIIRQLADFSRQNKEKATSRAKSNLKEIISEIIPLVRPGLSEKNIELKTDIPDNLPAVALSKDEMKQLFLNLLKNSQEAMGSEGTIFIGAHQENGWIVIEFGDTGPGVPEHLKEKIFSPFVTTKGDKNSGLGLSVCYGLVKAVGGEISLVEKEGFGAYFLIRIPTVDNADNDGCSGGGVL
ncbi:MAG: HDOD domain-containing protein [Thermodesulfobacteria bacterium]|nr:HDOD domain-containing protein [Thermodesulfobacteriota bacterium]